MSRLRNVTTALAAVLLTAPAAMAYDIQMPGNDTKLSVYGFVYALTEYYTTGASETNSSYLMDKGSSNMGNVLNQTKTPGNNLLMSVQPSRYGFASVTPTAAFGDITTKIEFDMNGVTTAGTAFHMRHAYATVGNWVFGHTYTAWIDLDALADEVDWQGLIGTPAYDTPRRPQIRYTFNFDKKNKLAVSVENNKGLDGDSYTAAGTAPSTTPAGVQDGKIPTLVLAYTYSDTWGHIGVRGVTMNHAEFIPATAGVDSVHFNKQGGAGMVSGDVKFGKDDLVFSAYYGSGLGDYGYGTQSANFVNTTANPEAVYLYKNVGWTVGYTHVFTPTWRANAVISGVNFKGDSDIATTNGTNGTDTKSRLDYLVNCFYTVNKNTQFGLEYFQERARPFGKGLVLTDNGSYANSATSGRVEFVLQAKF
ncbi:MAG: DcaP family trimeric outer membrane transporter [Holophaga sp.]|nr:DcaP family trimeric outer membrane transporter [Holophaga sp.]